MKRLSVSWARYRLPIVAIFFSVAVSSFASAGDEQTREASLVELPATPLPYSSFASPQAERQLSLLLAETRAGNGPASNDIAEQRRFYQRYNDDRLGEVERLYAAEIQRERLGGVQVDSVVPADGRRPATPV